MSYHDTFERADTTGPLGPGWNNGDGSVWGIDAGRAYQSTPGGLDGVTYRDAGMGEVDVTVAIDDFVSGICGLVIRYSDINNYIALTSNSGIGSDLALFKVVGGSNTGIQIYSGVAVNPGDILRLRAVGDQLTVWHNGTLIGTETDSFNQTATNVGMHGGVDGYFDSFSWVDSALIPWSPGDPWPSDTPGGAAPPKWGGYTRLWLLAAIEPGNPFHMGPHANDELDAGNVLSGGTDPLEGLVLIANDSFDRADAASLGSTDGDGSVDPQAWTVQNPTADKWNIASNAVTYIATGGSAQRGIATLELAEADVDLRVTLTPGDNQGICFRFTDVSNYWAAVWSGTDLVLQKREAGSTVPEEIVTGLGSGNKLLRVLTRGSRIRCFVDGTEVIDIDHPFNIAATKHGLYYSDSTSAGFDNFIAAAVPALDDPFLPATDVLSSDTFTRTAFGTLGSTEGIGSLDPLTYTTNNGVWGTSGGHARITTCFVSPARALLDVLTGDIDITLTVVARDTTSGIIFRHSGSTNYWHVQCDTVAFGVRLLKVVGGSAVPVGANYTAHDGDVIRVVALGDLIAVYRNGEVLEVVNDSHNETATQHGMHLGTNVEPIGQLDDLMIAVPILAPPPEPDPEPDDRLWVDLTCDLLELNIAGGVQGSQSVLNPPDAYTLSAKLYDPTGKYDPMNPRSPYAFRGVSRLVPGTPIQCYVEVVIDPSDSSWERFYLFTGTADKWAEDWRRLPNDRVAELIATDITKEWVKLQRPDTTPVGAGDSTIERVERLAAFYGWTGVIEASSSSVTHPATTFEESGWEKLSATMKVELGIAYFTPEGTLRWIGRSEWVITPTTTAINVGCLPPDMTDPSFYDIVVNADPERTDVITKNDIYATRPGGVTQRAFNAESIALHGSYEHSETDLAVEEDSQALEWASALLELNAFPRNTLEHVTLRPDLAPNVWEAWRDILGIRLFTDLARIVWTPPDNPDRSVDLNARIVGADHAITYSEWAVTWALLGATGIVADVWTLGSDPDDTLDDANVMG